MGYSEEDALRLSAGENVPLDQAPYQVPGGLGPSNIRRETLPIMGPPQEASMAQGTNLGVGSSSVSPVATELSPELKNLIEKAVGLSVSPGRKAALMGHLAGVVGGIQTARERNASDLAQANLTTQPSMLTAKANMESARAFSGAVGGIGKSQGQPQQPRSTWSSLFDNLTTKKNPLGTLGG